MTDVTSPERLPILPVLREALRIHWKYRVAFLVTVAAFAVLRLGMLSLAAESLAALMDVAAQIPDASVADVSMTKLMLAAFLYVVAVSVTFVVWVRLALLGQGKAFENNWSDWAAQIGRTGSLLVFAGLVTIVAMMPLTVIFNVAGPTAGGSQVPSGGLVGLALFGLAFYFLACVVYAYFSPKLVEAALGRGSPPEGGETLNLPSVLRLALVLFAALAGLFALGQILLSIDQAMPGSYTMLLLTLAAFVLFTTYLSVVHAVAYRQRRGMSEPGA